MRADGPLSSAKLSADRHVQVLAHRLHIVAGTRKSDRSPLRIPVSAKLESAGGHGHQGTWFDSAYAEKEAPGSELRHFQQKIDCVVRIRRTRDFSQGVQ